MNKRHVSFSENHELPSPIIHPYLCSEEDNQLEGQLKKILCDSIQKKTNNNSFQQRSFTQVVHKGNFIDKLIIDKNQPSKNHFKKNAIEYKIKHPKRPKNFTIFDFIPFTHKICAFDNIKMQMKKYIENNSVVPEVKAPLEDGITQTNDRQERMAAQRLESKVSTMNFKSNKKIGEKLIMKLKDSSINILKIKKKQLSKLNGIGKINIHYNMK